MSLCLDLGADSNIQDEKGFTPLMYVVAGDHVRNFKRLMYCESLNVSLKQDDGFKAIDYAGASVYATELKMVQRLQDRELGACIEKIKS